MIAQLCPLVKSTVFIAGISNFGFAYFKRYIFKLCLKHFRFIGTLRNVVGQSFPIYAVLVLITRVIQRFTLHFAVARNIVY